MPQSSWLPQFAPNTFAEERHDASQDVDGRHAERVARKCSTSCAVGARAADGSGHGTGRSPEDGFVAAVGIFHFRDLILDTTKLLAMHAKKTEPMRAYFTHRRAHRRALRPYITCRHRRPPLGL